MYKRKWIEETTYPHFTMIGQSLGSMYLAWEALCKFTPLYYFDTSGYAFTYPLARLFGCKVICYTHYPTISTDMLSRVRQRSFMYNNDALVAKRFDFQSLDFHFFFHSSNSSHASGVSLTLFLYTCSMILLQLLIAYILFTRCKFLLNEYLH